MKYLLKIAYCGEKYCGWQVQKNEISIQGELCRASGLVYGETVKITGCSRTDSGVHAKEYFCTLESSENAPLIPESKIPVALNRYLDEDITVFTAKKVDESFHARYSVKEKTYEYVFDNGSQRNPFLHKKAWHIPKPLDAAKMNEAAKLFIGEYDFRAFMASGSSVDDTVRRVSNASVVREGDNVIFKVSANGFLYNMVRIMAGTLRDVSIGKISVDSIKDIISGKDRSAAGLTAPPDGLYLTKVEY